MYKKLLFLSILIPCSLFGCEKIEKQLGHSYMHKPTKVGLYCSFYINNQKTSATSIFFPKKNPIVYFKENGTSGKVEIKRASRDYDTMYYLDANSDYLYSYVSNDGISDSIFTCKGICEIDLPFLAPFILCVESFFRTIEKNSNSPRCFENNLVRQKSKKIYEELFSDSSIEDIENFYSTINNLLEEKQKEEKQKDKELVKNLEKLTVDENTENGSDDESDYESDVEIDERNDC